MSGIIPSTAYLKPPSSASSMPIVSRKRKAVDIFPKKEEENSSLTQSNKTERVVKPTLRDSNKPVTYSNYQIKVAEDQVHLIRKRIRFHVLELCKSIVTELDLLGKKINLLEAVRSRVFTNDMERINAYTLYGKRRAWLERLIEQEGLQGLVTVPPPRRLLMVINCVAIYRTWVFVPLVVPRAYRYAQKISSCCPRCIRK